MTVTVDRNMIVRIRKLAGMATTRGSVVINTVPGAGNTDSRSRKLEKIITENYSSLFGKEAYEDNIRNASRIEIYLHMLALVCMVGEFKEGQVGKFGNSGESWVPVAVQEA